MGTHERIVVVGASLAGLRAAVTLREEGFAGALALVGAEPHRPYNRPPLSKSVLDGDDDVSLPGADAIDADWLGGRSAVRLDGAARTVALDDGTELPYDGLVIATGARPRRLPEEQMALTGVHVLRTLDDALELRKALADVRGRVVVMGGGFVGGEVASSVRAAGHEVAIVDAAEPMVRVLGRTVGTWLAEHHRANGVELVTNTRVAGLVGEQGRVTGVRLDGSRTLDADLVVVGTGVVPNTEWLEGSGVHLDDGVVTDERLFARGHTDIVAAGDVARWPHALFGDEPVRIEHWSNANEQGAAAARNLLRGPSGAVPFGQVPALGTRVHGTRIQYAGLPHLADASTVVTGAPEDGKFAVAFTREGVLVGAATVNFPKELTRLRKAIEAAESL
ncbi:NAD(P)/FAD-dependent oxidoreductase [Actinomadura rupiterrae]|uniref:NAD(P)/FAD-dependent oxidoreductase n=1 Tax=Actinomadura rupiterrae TaxID=559627 RepID=UPI0020A33355|nr:FAD-dependent oxidoreductase [Actinomadura rupiterrae]MCP2338654.1 NADPH-dependent 2,4-dienoyl-CoA reductase/sulfur reductase-like enzyme [Actinomadura rupiterrae]